MLTAKGLSDEEVRMYSFLLKWSQAKCLKNHKTHLSESYTGAMLIFHSSYHQTLDKYTQQPVFPIQEKHSVHRAIAKFPSQAYILFHLNKKADPEKLDLQILSYLAAWSGFSYSCSVQHRNLLLSILLQYLFFHEKQFLLKFGFPQ